MNRIGIYIDASNIYQNLGRKKLSYSKYLNFIEDMGDVRIRRVYSVTLGDSKDFENNLKAMGMWTTFVHIPRSEKRRFFDYRLDAAMALDIADSIDVLDTVIIGSAHPNIYPIVRWVQKKGIRVIIFASNIPASLAHIADGTFEIFGRLLI